jgi:hypothetical protein
MMEDPELASALTTGEGIDAAVARIERLAVDCGQLTVELHRFAGGELEALLGKSQQELLALMRSIDPATIADPRQRREVEAILAMGDVDLASRESDEPPPGEVPND